MKNELIKIEERNLVRTNKLINGKVKLKAKSYDLIRAFSSLVEYNDTDFWTYTIKVSDLDIDYKRAKEYIRDIMRNPIEIKDDIKEKFECYAWCSTMKYENGYIEAKLNPDLKEFMLQIRGNYTKTFEKYVLPMESIYAKRIYEMLIQNKDYGYRKFNLEQLQEVLNVPKSMKRYSDFKRFVLLTAIKEINKHSDIYIPVDITNLKDKSWIKLQCGKARKITHLNFEFRKKDDKESTKEPKQTQATQSIQEPKKVTYELIDKAIDRDMIFHFTNCDTIEKKQSLNNKIEEFIKYCVDNQKEYENYENSFSRYLEIAKQNNWNF